MLIEELKTIALVEEVDQKGKKNAEPCMRKAKKLSTSKQPCDHDTPNEEQTWLWRCPFNHFPSPQNNPTYLYFWTTEMALLRIKLKCPVWTLSLSLATLMNRTKNVLGKKKEKVNDFIVFTVNFPQINSYLLRVCTTETAYMKVAEQCTVS